MLSKRHVVQVLINGERGRVRYFYTARSAIAFVEHYRGLSQRGRRTFAFRCSVMK